MSQERKTKNNRHLLDREGHMRRHPESETRNSDRLYASFNFPLDRPPQTTNSSAIALAKMSESRAQDILGNCSQWHVACQRLTVGLDEAPLRVMKPLAGSASVNATNLYVVVQNFSGDSKKHVVNVEWLQQNVNAPFPSSPVPTIDTLANQERYDNYRLLNADYYSLYDVDWLLALINDALADANAAAATTVAPPIITCDSEQKFILWAEASYAFTGNPLTGIKLYFSFDLYQLFTGCWSSRFYRGNLDSLDADTQKCAYELMFIPQGTATGDSKSGSGNLVTDIPSETASPTPGFRLFQRLSPLKHWTSVRSLIVTTAQLPVLSEYVPVTSSSTSLNPGQQIIATVDLGAYSYEDTRDGITWEPDTLHFADMTNPEPLNRLDFQVYYIEDRPTPMFPLSVSSNNAVKLRLAFERPIRHG